MKKMIIFICIIAMLTTFITSCSNKEHTPSLYVIDTYDGNNVSIGSLEKYSLFKTEYPVYKTVKQKYKTTINGFDIVGEYERSILDEAFLSDVDNYRFEDENLLGMFQISRTTGKMVSYFISNYQKDYSNQQATKTLEECEEIAVQYLKSFDNESEFVLENEEYRKSPVFREGMGNVYELFFSKNIDGINTDVVAQVTVNMDGEICLTLCPTINSIDSNKDKAAIEKIKEFCKDDLIIKNEMNNIIKKYDEGANCQISDKRLVKYRDGNVGIKYLITVEYETTYIIDGKEEKIKTQDGHWLLVI